MNAKGDVNYTIEQIRNFWPDLPFNTEDITQGRPDFIIRFSTNFVAEINDKISYLCLEENVGDEHPENPEYDKRVTLYCKVNRIFKKMGYISINLVDFYVQNPKKMYPVVKCAIHFVIYLNNYLDNIFGIVYEHLNKLVEHDNCKILKQRILSENAEDAEHLARFMDIYNALEAKLEEVKKSNEKIDKVAAEKMFLEETSELNLLQNEVENLEYELKLLEDKEEDLKECIVTDTDFENMIKTEKILELEQAELCGDEFHIDDGIEKQRENAKELETYAQKLQALNFDSLDANSLLIHREQFTYNKKHLKELNDELCSLIDVSETKRKWVGGLQDSVEKAQARIKDVENKYSLNAEKEHNYLKEKTLQFSVKLEECQKLESQKIDLNEEINLIETNERILRDTVADEYRKILNEDKATTNQFHNWLLHIIKRCNPHG
ncbi:uncharacterized protein LOC123007136 [Tribolium madens]|uniref:uncharacterized protein LOC123007136 n=1 Tax=Tribolium madens TaxID=41895 RepID=UPI001CF75B04|nr:uncharacterized protein LOC123007136 [Tribolium madens]